VIATPAALNPHSQWVASTVKKTAFYDFITKICGWQNLLCLCEKLHSVEESRHLSGCLGFKLVKAGSLELG
jgi:hypothetical protein